MQRTNSWLANSVCNIFHIRFPAWLKYHFSMLELLIVIAILVILVSLLLPALRKAREQAQMITCCNQQRSILQGGIMMYVNDYNDRLPAYDESAENHVSWPEKLSYPYLVTSKPGTAARNRSFTNFWKCPATVLEVFAGNDRIRSYEITATWNDKGKHLSGGWTFWNERITSKRITRIYPNSVLMADCGLTNAYDGYAYVVQYLDSAGLKNLSYGIYRHGLKGVFLFTDGHIISLRYPVNLSTNLTLP